MHHKHLRVFSFSWFCLLPAVLFLLASGTAVAQTPTYKYDPMTGGNNTYPLGNTAGNRVQNFYVPGNIVPAAPAGWITDVYYKASGPTAPTATTYTNLTISIGTTALLQFAGGASPWNAGLTQVFYMPSYVAPATPVGSWVKFTLQTPFFWNGTSNLIVEVKQSAYTGSGIYVLQGTMAYNSRMYGLYANPNCTGTDGQLAAFGFDMGNIVQPPTITANPNPLCSGGTLTLSATSTSPNPVFNWTGPGLSATGPSVTIPNMTTAQAGVYSCTVTSGSATSLPSTVNVTVHQTPENVTAGSNSGVCSGSVLNLTGSSSTGGVSYSWVGPNSFSSSVQNPTISGITQVGAGVYTLTANNNGCMSTATTNVTVHALPVLSAMGTSPAICFGNDGFITLTGLSPSSSYTLNYMKDGVPAGASGITTDGSGQYVIIGLGIGTYSGITVTDGNGCSSAPVPSITLVQPILVPTPVVTGNTPVCLGSDLNLSASSMSGSGYSWYGPSGFGSSVQSPVITGVLFSHAGVYKVVANNQGCLSDTGTITVVVNGLPASVLTALGDTNICLGNSVVLDANTGAGLSYSWQQNGNTIPGANGSSYTALTSGVYTVTVTDGNGCSRVSNPKTVNALPTPVSQISHTTPLTFCEGNSVVLYASPDPNPLTYIWYKDGIAITGATAGSYTVYQSGVYSVRETNQIGCTDLSSGVTVTVIPVLNPIITRNGNVLSTTGFTNYQWFKNNMAIPGATTSSITITENAYYQVEGTDGNGCVSKSAIAWIEDLTGLGEEEWYEGGIRLYPNPVSDVLYIEGGSAGGFTVLVRNLQGQEVVRGWGVSEVRMGSLAEGLYVVSVMDVEGRLIRHERILKMNR